VNLGRLLFSVWIVASLCWAAGSVYLLWNDLLLRDCNHVASSIDASMCALNYRDRYLNPAQREAIEWIVLPPSIGFALGIGLFICLRRYAMRG
jgi:hypothetical protein